MTCATRGKGLLTLQEHLSLPPLGFWLCSCSLIFSFQLAIVLSAYPRFTGPDCPFDKNKRFEDIKGAIRIRISKKNRQHNGQKKKHKRTNNDLLNIHKKLVFGTFHSILLFIVILYFSTSMGQK